MSVAPIAGIVVPTNYRSHALRNDYALAGALVLILGMGLFSLGAECSHDAYGRTDRFTFNKDEQALDFASHLLLARRHDYCCRA